MAATKEEKPRSCEAVRSVAHALAGKEYGFDDDTQPVEDFFSVSLLDGEGV